MTNSTPIVEPVGTFPIARLMLEVYEVNLANGWFDDERSLGMTKALLHSEVSEMLEAHRQWGWDVVPTVFTTPPLGMDQSPEGWELLNMFTKAMEGGHTMPSIGDRLRLTGAHGGFLKPEGFGAELADVLIRWLDTVYRFNMRGNDFSDVNSTHNTHPISTDVGTAVTQLHDQISMIWNDANRLRMRSILACIFAVAEQYNVKLEDEFKFKLAFNRTRGYKHGGKNA